MCLKSMIVSDKTSFGPNCTLLSRLFSLMMNSLKVRNILLTELLPTVGFFISPQNICQYHLCCDLVGMEKNSNPYSVFIIILILSYYSKNYISLIGQFQLCQNPRRSHCFFLLLNVFFTPL